MGGIRLPNGARRGVTQRGGRLDEPEEVQRIRDDMASWRKWFEWEFTRLVMAAIDRRLMGKM